MSIINKIVVRIERFFSRRWYNPFATIWLNFRVLPFIQAIKLPLAVYGRPNFLELGGNVVFDCPVKHSIIKLNSSHPAAPSYQGGQLELGLRGKIIFKGYGQIDPGSKIFVYSEGVLELGEGFKICDYVNIGCYKRITVGKMSWITHRCQVFDTNYHFVANLNAMVIPSPISPVEIGDYCWICNSTTITGGTQIPSHTIIGSNSLVNKPFNILPYSIIAGIPAKLIGTGYRKVESIPYSLELYQYYNNPKADIFKLDASIDESIFLSEK